MRNSKISKTVALTVSMAAILAMTACGATTAKSTDTTSTGTSQAASSATEATSVSVASAEDSLYPILAAPSIPGTSDAAVISSSNGETEYLDKTMGLYHVGKDVNNNGLMYITNKYADPDHLYTMQTYYINVDKDYIKSTGEEKYYHDVKLTCVTPVDYGPTITCTYTGKTNDDYSATVLYYYNTSDLSSEEVSALANESTRLTEMGNRVYMLQYVKPDKIEVGTSGNWTTYAVYGLKITNEVAFEMGELKEAPSDSTKDDTYAISSIKMFVDKDGTWASVITLYNKPLTYSARRDTYIIENTHFDYYDAGSLKEKINSAEADSSNLELPHKDSSSADGSTSSTEDN